MRALIPLVALTFIACGDDDPDPNNPPGGGDDPWSIATWFNASGLSNREAAANLDASGAPTASSPALVDGSTYVFDAPATWAGRSVTGLADVAYVGAFDPDSSSRWTDDWTIGIDGRDAVWDLASGGTLSGATPSAAADTCPAGTTQVDTFNSYFDEGSVDVELASDEASLFSAGDFSICELPRVVETDLTLTNDNVYKIQPGFPGTKVGRGDDDNAANDIDVTVTVEPGTLVFGAEQEGLVITRGAELVAEGTWGDPIVFTSKKQLTQRFDGNAATAIDSGRGEWAGLALMGRARSNECGASFANCNVEAEGNIGQYGGDDDSDDSGSLSYVVVRHAGNDIDGQGNELNGISYFGTGAGTESRYIQVHRNLDDGIEHFGSTDFVSHVVLTGNADDSVDWGQGWTGGAQFVLVLQDADAADHGIEADNDGTNPDAVPISEVLIANATFVGQPSGEVTSGVLLRRGTKAQIWNTIVTGYAGGCIDIDDPATFARAGSDPSNPAADLVMRNSVVDCATSFIEE